MTLFQKAAGGNIISNFTLIKLESDEGTECCTLRKLIKCVMMIYCHVCVFWKPVLFSQQYLQTTTKLQRSIFRNDKILNTEKSQIFLSYIILAR